MPREAPMRQRGDLRASCPNSQLSTRLPLPLPCLTTPFHVSVGVTQFSGPRPVFPPPPSGRADAMRRMSQDRDESHRLARVAHPDVSRFATRVREAKRGPRAGSWVLPLGFRTFRRGRPKGQAPLGCAAWRKFRKGFAQEAGRCAPGAQSWEGEKHRNDAAGCEKETRGGMGKRAHPLLLSATLQSPKTGATCLEFWLSFFPSLSIQKSCQKLWISPKIKSLQGAFLQSCKIRTFLKMSLGGGLWEPG